MTAVDRLRALLPVDAAQALEARAKGLTELRLRAGRPAQLAGMGFSLLAGEAISAERLREIIAALLDYSVYARQSELDHGFFTLDDGSRVGVCGRVFDDGGRPRMGEIGSLCLRVSREVHGCADGLMEHIVTEAGLRPMLVVSPPGMGKTTLLRDIARQLSARGFSVGVADERHELAACRLGVPTLDVGPRTDVMDGCPRPDAIRRLVRAMAPQVVIADEIGGPGDAEALADAARCGVAVVASAHGGGIGDALARSALRPAAEVFREAALLGPRPGEVIEVREL